MKKNAVIAIILVSLAIIASRFYTTCDFVGGWNRGTEQHCSCVGKTILLDNSLASDGNYYTKCLGINIPK